VHGITNPNPDRDWSKFEKPPKGAPAMLRVFYRFNMGYSSIDIQGKWGDANPTVVSFRISHDIINVIRVEMHNQGECIYSKNYKPAIKLKGNSIIGFFVRKKPKTSYKI
jgi:hypothetical protein